MKSTTQNNSIPSFYSSKPNVAALELLHGAYEIVKDWNAETPEQLKWKQRWLEKAKELGANIFIDD